MPEMAHPRPEMAHPRPEMAHPRSEMAHPRPEMAHPRPEMAHPRSEMARARPKGFHPRSQRGALLKQSGKKDIIFGMGLFPPEYSFRPYITPVVRAVAAPVAVMCLFGGRHQCDPPLFVRILA